MNAYVITIRHAGGLIALQATGSDERAAIDKVLRWEEAPESALVSVQDYGPLIGQADNAGTD